MLVYKKQKGDDAMGSNKAELQHQWEERKDRQSPQKPKNNSVSVPHESVGQEFVPTTTTTAEPSLPSENELKAYGQRGRTILEQVKDNPALFEVLRNIMADVCVGGTKECVIRSSR